MQMLGGVQEERFHGASLVEAPDDQGFQIPSEGEYEERALPCPLHHPRQGLAMLAMEVEIGSEPHLPGLRTSTGPVQSQLRGRIKEVASSAPSAASAEVGPGPLGFAWVQELEESVQAGGTGWASPGPYT